MKRILTVQDISCVGKCSGTVALPVISAFGAEACILPTAVLSTHTAFTGFTFCDLTDEIPAIEAHWKQEKLTFDAFYSGYLGSIRQVQMVKELFTSLQRKGQDLIFVDPVMADNGKLYAGFTPEFAAQMRTLCAEADLLLPNLTEACYLLGKGNAYRTDFTRTELEDLLKELAATGASKVMLTGAELHPGRIGALLYDAKTDTFDLAETEKLPAQFHGTGDLFASAVLGAMISGKSVPDAMALAVDYVAEVMKETLADPDHVWYGVNFESAFPWLFRRIYDE